MGFKTGNVNIVMSFGRIKLPSNSVDCRATWSHWPITSVFETCLG